MMEQRHELLITTGEPVSDLYSKHIRPYYYCVAPKLGVNCASLGVIPSPHAGRSIYALVDGCGLSEEASTAETTLRQQRGLRAMEHM